MVVSVLLPDLRSGGTERVMVTLVNAFSARGIDTELVLQRKRGHYLDSVSDAVTIVSLDAPHPPGYTASGALPGLIRYLRRAQPSVMLSALARMNVVAASAHRVARSESRLVLSERNHLSRWVDNGGLRYRLFPTLVGWTYPWSDAVIAVSDGVADDLALRAGLERNGILTIPNPSFTPEVIAGQNEPVEHPWFDDSTEPVILGVGSFTEQKDFPTLIQAFDRLRSQRPAKLAILGDGPERTNLESMVHDLDLVDDVWLPGTVSNPYKYMRHASVFVLSSRWEGLPNVLIEALGCGTPVVATDCPSGPAYILEKGTYGSLVPVGRPDRMAEAIGQVMDDPPSADLLRSRAQDFAVEPIVDLYLEVLLPEE